MSRSGMPYRAPARARERADKNAAAPRPSGAPFFVTGGADDEVRSMELRHDDEDTLVREHTPPASSPLPVEAAARKALPIVSGCLDYFPDALAAVAELSRIGNDQHNPGEPLHWARGKSTDEADALLRHLMDRGTIDIDGVRHSTKVAWRALANLQKEIEAATGAGPSRGSK